MSSWEKLFIHKNKYQNVLINEQTKFVLEIVCKTSIENTKTKYINLKRLH